jgi:hypothetical protein
MTRLILVCLLICGLPICVPSVVHAQDNDSEWDDSDWWSDESSVKRPGFILEGALPVPRALLEHNYEGDYGYGISVVLSQLDFTHWRAVRDKIRLRYTEDWLVLKDATATPLGLTDSDARARLWGISVGAGSAGKFVGNRWFALSGYHGMFVGIYGLDVSRKAFSVLETSSMHNPTASPLNNEDNQGQFGFSHELALRFCTRHVGVQAGYEFVEVKRALVFWPAVIHGVIQAFATEALPQFLEKYGGHGWAVQVSSWIWRAAITAAAHHLQSYHTDWFYDREHPLLLQRWRAGVLFYL